MLAVLTCDVHSGVTSELYRDLHSKLEELLTLDGSRGLVEVHDVVREIAHSNE